MKKEYRQELIQSVKTYHSNLSDEYIKNMDDVHLDAYAHPTDREKVRRKIESDNRK